MRKFIFLILLLLITINNVALASLKDSGESPVAKWYKVYWGGIHIADLVASVGSGRFDAVIESYGLVRKLSNYSSKTVTYFDQNGEEFVPKSFYTQFQQKKRNRVIDIKYSDNGKISGESVTPPDNRAKRPAVENNLKEDSVDPLTAVMIARQKIKESLNSDQTKFSFNVYDGRRLARLDFNILGQYTKKIKGKKYNTIKVVFKRVALAGFTNNELKRMKGEEPDFTMYLDNDKNLFPVKIEADAPMGSAVLLLEKECNKFTECLVR